MKQQILQWTLAVLTLFMMPSTGFAAKWKAEHVILIGLDGWGSYSVEKANMPWNLKERCAKTALSFPPPVPRLFPV